MDCPFEYAVACVRMRGTRQVLLPTPLVFYGCRNLHFFFFIFTFLNAIVVRHFLSIRR